MGGDFEEDSLPQYGAIQIVKSEEKHKFILDYEALERILLQDHVKDKHVVVVSVAGKIQLNWAKQLEEHSFFKFSSIPFALLGSNQFYLKLCFPKYMKILCFMLRISTYCRYNVTILTL
jgi:hypothetical protein